MKLNNFFTLVFCGALQNSLQGAMRETFRKSAISDRYMWLYPYMPYIVCKDGFSISLQVSNGNYCNSENGYQQFGYQWKEVEFGFPSEEEELLKEFADDEDVCNSVGSISIELAEEVLAKHGGIDLDRTLSKENLEKTIFREM